MKILRNINEDPIQINNFNRRAEQLAKITKAKGAILITYTETEENEQVSIGCHGLTFAEMLYALSCGIHHAYVFEEQENS